MNSVYSVKAFDMGPDRKSAIEKLAPSTHDTQVRGTHISRTTIGMLEHFLPKELVRYCTYIVWFRNCELLITPPRELESRFLYYIYML